MEYILGAFIILIIGAIGMWLRKRYLKKIMSQGLGREVEDRELTSITEWMEAIPDERGKYPPRPRS